MPAKRKTKKKWTDKTDFSVSVDMFRVDIVFVCNCNEQEVLARLNKACGSNFQYFNKEEIAGWDDNITHGRMIPFRGGFIVLIKNNTGNFRRFISIFVHEITHVSHYLLRDRRIPLNIDTEEVYCYLTEYITEQALLKLYS